MFVANYISSLYQDPQLARQLTPQRWCNRQWTLLVSPLDNNRNKAIQVAVRIIQMVLFILPTVAAYILGAAVVLDKLLFDRSSVWPLPIVYSYRFLDTVDPLGNNTAPPAPGQENAIQAYHRPSHFPDSENRNNSVVIVKDNFIYAATWLGAREHMKMMKVSKFFNQCMHSPVLWSKHLNNYKAWATTRQWGSIPEGEDQGYQKRPLDELKGYYLLYKTLKVIYDNQVFDYLARRMPGGPIAFDALPKVRNDYVFSQNADNVDDVSHTFIGRDLFERQFFALRVIDRTEENGTPAFLVFLKISSFSGRESWVQLQNKYWPKKTLKLLSQNQVRTDSTSNRINSTVLDYLLALMKKESLVDNPNFSDAIYNKNIALV